MKLSSFTLRHAAASALLALSLPALAEPSLLPAQSELGFAIRQMGVPVQGQFNRFSAQTIFDPAKPAQAYMQFTVELGSATLGTRELDAELPKPTWFNTPKFPQAQFTSSALRRVDATHYEVQGKVAIKGVTREVTVPVVFSQSGALTTTSGTVALKRLAFGIGDGDWADTSLLADEVQVHFKLVFAGIGKL
jgi:polyisoprenoid-binding protein YceI